MCNTVLRREERTRPRRRALRTEMSAAHTNDDDDTNGSSSIDEIIPPGRVKDAAAWLQLSSDSLQQLTGTSLLDRLPGVTTFTDMHRCERYAVLSHGTQEDPIYCYLNAGAMSTFQFPVSNVYQMPSRYSAPSGKHRQARQAALHSASSAKPPDAQCFPSIIRQDVNGRQFALQHVWYWTVYNNSTVVGQTAFFDRDLVVPVEASPEGGPPGIE